MLGLSAVGLGKLGFPETSTLEGDSQDGGVFGFEVFGESTDDVVGVGFDHKSEIKCEIIKLGGAI